MPENCYFCRKQQKNIMPNPFFEFKQFTVYHDRCAMKVGTDGVLLGAWTDVSSSHHILDIGTGTGLIALMLAQRCAHARITAMDIETEAIEQARNNFLISPWKDRIEAVLQDIKSFSTSMTYDTIVSNPPYFVKSLKCPNNQRNTARHTDTLDADSLFKKAAMLLSEEGRFSIIIPAEQTEEVTRIALSKKLYLSRQTMVITRHGLSPKRTLMEFRKFQTTFTPNDLLIELDRHVYSKDYISLTRDFYLKM